MAHDCPRDGTPALGFSRCYGHLKAAALNGGRDSLPKAELAFVGFTKPSRSEDSWRPADLYAGILESLSHEELETFEVLRELPTASQVDFAG